MGQYDDDARMQRWMLERCFRTLAMPTVTAPGTTTAAPRKFFKIDGDYDNMVIGDGDVDDDCTGEISAVLRKSYLIVTTFQPFHKVSGNRRNDQMP